MGWIVLIIIICIIIVIVLLNLSHRKKVIKSESQNVTTPIPDEYAEDNAQAAVDYRDKYLNKILQPSKTKRQQRIYKRETTFGLPTEQTRSYTRYERERIFKESIKSPFPEELSPASHYLYEANKLEREGADQALVEQALAKARQLDDKATEIYIGRWSVMKKLQKQKD